MLNKKACWIYSSDAKGKNEFFKFRREFFCGKTNGKETLSITADSRYSLYINGEYVGFGPVRAYPDHYKYDTYNISPYVKKGKNVIAVLLNHYDADTFQYLSRRGGLLASAEIDGEIILTDEKWLCGTAEEYETDVPRISCQQSYEEQYDARKYDGWKETEYNGSLKNAAVTAPYEDGIHKDLEERGIPFLTREEIYPKKVVEVCEITCRNNYFSANYESLLPRAEFSNMPEMYFFYAAAEFYSENAAALSLIYMFNSAELFVNGEKYGGGKIKIQNGFNKFVFKIRGVFHNNKLTFVLSGETQLVLKSFYMSPFLGPEDGDGKLPDSSYHLYQTVNGEKFDAEQLKGYEAALLKGDFSALENRIDLCVKEDVFAATYYEKAETANIKKYPSVENLTSDGDFAEIVSDGKDVRLLIDFGNELVGNHILECVAEESTVIDFHNFEFIQPDGLRCYADGMNNTMRYTAKGGWQSYRSEVRRGFRYSYVTIRNFNKILLKLKLENSVYPQLSRGTFFCDDYKINEIVKIGKNTLKCCSEDTYTDCPTYEQAFWVGDARNEALCDIAANGDWRLWKRCLILTGQSLKYSPLTLSQVPSGWWNILPAWSFLWMRSVNEYSYYTNDYEGCLQLSGFLKKNVDGILSNINADGLFQINGWNMFDWADMDTPSDGAVTHLNCFAVQALKESQGFFKYVNDFDTAEICSKTAESIKAAVNKYLWNESAGAYTDCIRYRDGKRVQSEVYSQQTQTVAFIAEVGNSPKRTERIKELSINPPQNFVKAGSPFFEFFKLEMLIGDGNQQSFIEEIRNNWGFMVDKGCDTFWEMWSIGQKSGRMTRSHCHGWSAAPVYYMSEYVLGVKPVERAYKKVKIQPHSCGLNWCRGTVPTPYGDISVKWERLASGEIKTEYDAPADIEVVTE